MTRLGEEVSAVVAGDEEQDGSVTVDVLRLSSGLHIVAIEVPEQLIVAFNSDREARVLGLSSLGAAQLARSLAHASAEALKLNQESGLAAATPPAIVRPH